MEYLQWLLCQFEKVAVQYWPSADLLFLNKNIIQFEYVLRTLLVETILTVFYWLLACRIQKLVGSKAMQQGLSALIPGFWQI